MHSVTILWSQKSPVPTSNQLHILGLLMVSHGALSYTENIHLNHSYFYFAAPENAGPCEVYNFSINATQSIYDSATYTGAGCSRPSDVLSIMLPSLPAIDRLEPSLGYLLEKRTAGGVTISISFLVR